jgi:PAB-dependent poly(A)-specific ribonuclease subunit 2
MSSSTYHPLEPLVNFPVTYPQVPTALSFDPVSDVLWVGSASGSVCAHYGETTSNGVTFPASSAHGEPVLKLLASENDVKALVRDAIGSWGKGGVNKWYHK